MNFDIARTLGEALTLHQAGSAGEAECLYRQILAVDPDNVHTLHLLGVAAYHAGRNAQARQLIGKAIALDDAVADFHCNMALVLYALGHPEEAERHCRRAIDLDPGHAETHNNFGNALTEQGRLEEAQAHLRRAITVRPGYAEAHFNLANALRRLDRNCEAVAHYREAIALRPGFANAHYNLGHVLSEEGELSEAETHYRQAIALAPDRADFHNNLGVTLHQLDRLPEAEACYRRVLAVCPDHAVALDNLATVQRITCRTGEAIASLRRAIEISPESHAYQTNLIFALNFDPTATPEGHQAERASFDARHARQFVAMIRPHGNDPDPQRLLRVGYVSSHFCHQAATFAFAGVILNHDPKHFEVICYSDAAKEDAITHRLRARADRWHHTAKLSDDGLADLVRSDRVDILVDLVGHMSGHRLLMFARKPAPIQVTAWGEPTGTGLKTMDYLMADPILVPANQRTLLAEKVADLPNFLGFWVSEPLPDPGPLPALMRGFATFGSFNRLEKMPEPVVRSWTKILNAVPNSRILLKNSLLRDPSQRERVIGLFAANGVAPARVELLAATGRPDHFHAYRSVDLALDPFPHGGGMTTLDALWMGVPVVTAPGRTISSRLAAASLTAAGLTDFIAPDLDGYVELAVAKATDLASLAQLRADLRRRMEATDFGDPVRYARAAEAAYRDMWRGWCTAHRE